MTTIVLGATLALWLASGPAVQEPVTKPRLIGNPGVFFGPDSYPPAARRANEAGRVSMKLRVGADGRVTNCDVTSQPIPNLDADTCAIALAKLTFEPARDAVGKPVSSDYPLSILWQLGPPEPSGGEFVPMKPIEVSTTSFQPGLVETEIVIDEEGRVASCRLSAGRAGGDVCAAYPIGQKVGPGFVRDGKPIRAIMRERREMSTEFLP